MVHHDKFVLATEEEIPMTNTHVMKWIKICNKSWKLAIFTFFLLIH
jgi:hypothetical protein